MDKSMARLEKASEIQIEHVATPTTFVRSAPVDEAHTTLRNRLMAVLEEIDRLRSDLNSDPRKHEFNTGLYTGIELCRDVIKEVADQTNASESVE